jgi:hypothetical protein
MPDGRSGNVRQCLRQDRSRRAPGCPEGRAGRTPTMLTSLGRSMACGSSALGHHVQLLCARAAMSAMAIAETAPYPRWWPADGRRLDIRPDHQTAPDTGMATEHSLVTCAGHRPSGRWSFRKRRTVNPLTVRTRYNFLYASSRPALRAAACGGRPRPPGHHWMRPPGHLQGLLLHGDSHAVAHQHLRAVGAHHTKDDVELKAGGTRRGRHSLKMPCTRSAL